MKTSEMKHITEECEWIRLEEFKKMIDELKDLVDGLDNMFFSKSVMGYSNMGDTWTILKQDWNKIVDKFKELSEKYFNSPAGDKNRNKNAEKRPEPADTLNSEAGR